MDIANFNHLESVLWFLMALALFAALLKNGFAGPYAKILACGSLSFALFGISDIIEASTGAWWRPVWLLAIKAVCIVMFIGCYLAYRRIKRRESDE